MAAKDGNNLRQYVLYSESISTAVGSEPARYIGVNFAGAPAANAVAVSNVSRDGRFSAVMLGLMPARVKDGATITKGQAVSTDSNGHLIPATALTGILGIALDSVTTASGDYIEIFVNTSPAVA